MFESIANLQTKDGVDLMLDFLTAEILKQAIAAAQRGNLGLAREIADNGLRQAGDVVALNAFLGMLSARQGDFKTATKHLYIAHLEQQFDITIACNLIAVMIDSSDLVGAFNIATWDLALSDPSLRVAKYRGFLAQSLEAFAEAVQAYEYVVERLPDDFESWNNLGNARLPLNDFSGSVHALQRAVALDVSASPTRLNLVAALTAANQLAEAEDVLFEATNDFPNDIRILQELFMHYKRGNKQEDALAVLEKAVVIDSGNADLQLKLGSEYGILLRTVDAEKAYRQAIASDPQLADAYLGLAIQYEHMNREDEFAPLVALAVANGLNDGVLGFLRALEYRRAGRFADSLNSLAFVPSTLEPERSAHIRATLLERLGQSDKAFTAFEQTSRLHQLDPSNPLQRARRVRDQLRSEVQLLTPALISTWCPKQPENDRPDPIFLVGFPRSGTTLLDTILMGHPHTTVLEEKPALNHVDDIVGGLAGIASLGAKGIIEAREKYYEEVDALEKFPVSNRLIDKSPLFLQKVPLIQRLFPNARFILVLRHPCDVILSCFMSNFRLNSAMANFLQLNDAAEFYDLTFQHWARSCDIFSPKVHTIVYEKLVENMEAEVRPLFDFLDLEWHDDVLDHQRTAKLRGLITTASYSQVTEPIYQRASGRWVGYREKLEPIIPILKPWIERFGYTT